MARQMKKRKGGVARKRKGAGTTREATRRQIGKEEDKDEPASAPDDAGC